MSWILPVIGVPLPRKTIKHDSAIPFTAIWQGCVRTVKLAWNRAKNGLEAGFVPVEARQGQGGTFCQDHKRDAARYGILQNLP